MDAARGSTNDGTVRNIGALRRRERFRSDSEANAERYWQHSWPSISETLSSYSSGAGRGGMGDDTLLALSLQLLPRFLLSDPGTSTECGALFLAGPTR